MFFSRKKELKVGPEKQPKFEFSTDNSKKEEPQPEPKEEPQPEPKEEFVGWGCYGIMRDGSLHPDMRLENYTKMENMVADAVKYQDIIGIQIFACFEKKETRKENPFQRDI